MSRLYLPAAVLLLASLLTTPAGAYAAVVGCGESLPAPVATLIEVQSDTPLYGFSNSGSFYRSNFNGRPAKLISRHDFADLSGLTLSRNGRFLAYSGSLKLSYEDSMDRHDVEQLWLHDLKTGSGRLVLQIPAWSLAGTKAQFSPDGRWLATSVDPDSRHPSYKRHGLVLIDTKNDEIRYVGYPPGLRLSDSIFSDVAWAETGAQLLFYMRSGDEWTYFTYAPAS